MYTTMSANISSSSAFLHPLSDRCSRSRPALWISTAFTVASILLILPLSFVVLHLGFQRWRRRQSASPAAAGTASHSDCFTLNTAAMTLIEMLGQILHCVGGYAAISQVMKCGYDLFSITWCVKLQFHTLTCVERYLAVFHPVVYLGLKNNVGVRIRNISIACLWLMFALWVAYSPFSIVDFNLILFFSLLALAFVVICFCSVSVLYALRRPSPGETCRDREQVDQTKRRAFHTILAIMGTLLLSVGAVLVCDALYVSFLLRYSDACVVAMLALWFFLPSNAVLPVLYLHRAGKLPRCSRDPESS